MLAGLRRPSHPVPLSEDPSRAQLATGLRLGDYFWASTPCLP